MQVMGFFQHCQSALIQEMKRALKVGSEVSASAAYRCTFCANCFTAHKKRRNIAVNKDPSAFQCCFLYCIWLLKEVNMEEMKNEAETLPRFLCPSTWLSALCLMS